MNSRISVIASIIIGMLVTSMDTTITNTTMPIIAKELGGFELYAWSFASYMIVSTILSPLAGRLSDIFGRKRVFAAGIILFLLGSLLCGSARTMLQLVIYRAIQGIGAGIMMPFPAIIAGDLFAIEQRGKIQAFFTAMWGLSAVLAPMLGAFFVKYATWRWIFYVNIPICLLALFLLLPYQEVYIPKRASVDYFGALLFAFAVSFLLIATTVNTKQVLYVFLGLLLSLIFYSYEKRQTSPIVPLSLFQNRPVAWMILNSFLSCASLFGASTYIPLFLQKEGYSIFMSGVALLGMSFGWIVVAVPAGKWILRFGYRALIIAGNILLVISGGLFLLLNQDTGFGYVFLNLIIQGLAFGLLSTVSIIGAQHLVEPHQKGISTSLQMFSRNIGTAIGITVMGAFLTKANNFIGGIHAIFVYGTLVGLLSLASSFFIREEEHRIVEQKA